MLSCQKTPNLEKDQDVTSADVQKKALDVNSFTNFVLKMTKKKRATATASESNTADQQLLFGGHNPQHIAEKFFLNEWNNDLFEKTFLAEKEKIGHGAFGKVYQLSAPNPLSTHLPLALKLMKFKGNTLREMDHMICLRGMPGILPLQKVVFLPQNNDLALVMNLGEMNLEAFQHQREAEERHNKIKEVNEDYYFLRRLITALEITRRLLLSMRNVHEKGIIHRDLKNLNILVSSKAHMVPDPWIIDWGLSKRHSESVSLRDTTSEKYDVVTCSYRAPELWMESFDEFTTDDEIEVDDDSTNMEDDGNNCSNSNNTNSMTEEDDDNEDEDEERASNNNIHQTVIELGKSNHCLDLLMTEKDFEDADYQQLKAQFNLNLQNQSSHTYNSSIDLWSIGCMLYVMLANQHPFHADHSTETQIGRRIFKYTFYQMHHQSGQRTLLEHPLCKEIVNRWKSKYPSFSCIFEQQRSHLFGYNHQHLYHSQETAGNSSSSAALIQCLSFKALHLLSTLLNPIPLCRNKAKSLNKTYFQDFAKNGQYYQLVQQCFVHLGVPFSDYVHRYSLWLLASDHYFQTQHHDPLFLVPLDSKIKHLLEQTKQFPALLTTQLPSDRDSPNDEECSYETVNVRVELIVEYIHIFARFAFEVQIRPGVFYLALYTFLRLIHRISRSENILPKLSALLMTSLYLASLYLDKDLNCFNKFGTVLRSKLTKATPQTFANHLSRYTVQELMDLNDAVLEQFIEFSDKSKLTTWLADGLRSLRGRFWCQNPGTIRETKLLQAQYNPGHWHPVDEHLIQAICFFIDDPTKVRSADEVKPFRIPRPHTVCKSAFTQL